MDAMPQEPDPLLRRVQEKRLARKIAERRAARGGATASDFADVAGGGSQAGDPPQARGAGRTLDQPSPSGSGYARLAALGKVVPGLLREGVQGASLGFADDIADLGTATGERLRGLATGEETPGVSDRFNALQREGHAERDAFRQEHPIAATGANLAGGILNPLSRVSGTGGSLFQRMLRGTGMGALGGGLTGAGEAEGGPMERLTAAKDGALVGGAIGGAVPLVAKTAQRIFTPKNEADRVGELLDNIAGKAGVKRVNPSRAAQELDATRTNLTRADYAAARPQTVRLKPEMKAALSDPEFVRADREAAALSSTKNQPYTSIFVDGQLVDDVDLGSLQTLKRVVNERMKAAKMGTLPPDPGQTMTPSTEYQQAVRDRNATVVKGMRQQSPEFERAETNFARVSREIEELKLGQMFDNPKKFPTPQDVSDHLGRITNPEERTRFIQGMIAKAEKGGTRSRQSRDAFTRIFNSEDVKQRLRAAIPAGKQREAFDRMVERQGAWSAAKSSFRRSLLWQTGIGPAVRASTAGRDILGQYGGRRAAQGLESNEALVAFLLGQQAGGSE